MMDESAFNPAARLRSLGHAFRGLRHLVASQPHARIHAAATLAVVALAWYLKLSRAEWALLLVAIGLVWMAEAFNTALECLADAVHPGRHPLVGRAKDVAAAAVLISALAAVAIGLLILLPRAAATRPPATAPAPPIVSRP